MKLKTCPHCGQIIPPKLTFPGPISQGIYAYISKHPEGVSREQIASAVYADDPNGGPDDPTTIRVLIYKINKTLKHHGVEIRSSGSRGAQYTLRPLEHRTNGHRPNPHREQKQAQGE